jgi:hypothetical protein
MVWIFKLNFIKGILKTSTYIQHSWLCFKSGDKLQ